MTNGPSDGDVPRDHPPGAGGWGQPPPGQAEQPSPPGQPPPPPQPSQPSQGRRHPLVVVGGILMGLFLGFFGLPYASIVLVERLSFAGNGTVLGLLGFGSPILIGLALLIPRQLRHVGAGILMGLSIGMIVGSAACLGILGLFIASYGGGSA